MRLNLILVNDSKRFLLDLSEIGTQNLTKAKRSPL